MNYYTTRTLTFSGKTLTDISIYPSISELLNVIETFIKLFDEPGGMEIIVGNDCDSIQLDRYNSQIFQLNRISKKDIFSIINKNMDLVLNINGVSFSFWGNTGSGVKLREDKIIEYETTGSGTEIHNLLETLAFKCRNYSNEDFDIWLSSIKERRNNQTTVVKPNAIINRFREYGFQYFDWDPD